MKIVTAILRAFQLLFAIVILGVSVNLAKGQHIGMVPIRTGLSAAAGALGMLASLVGIAAIVLSSIPEIVTWGLDGIAGIVFLAGGIADAIGIGGTTCSTWKSTSNNDLLNGGYNLWYHVDQLQKRCTSFKADTAFMFLSFITCAVVLGWTFLKGSGTTKSRGTGSYV